MIPDDFIRIVEGIREMRIRGASGVARAAAEGLKGVALRHSGNLGELRRDLMRARQLLLQTRPTAVTIRNAVNWILMRSAGGDVDSLRWSVVRHADRFIMRTLQARSAIGRFASERIQNGGTYMTHCNSSAVISAFAHARKEGKEFSVYVTETRPWRQGLITAEQLVDLDITVRFIVDSAVRHIMGVYDLDAVFVGADTVCSNGAVVNKIGTSMVAACAHEARIPFYVCAETYKFSAETLAGRLVEIEERSPHEVVDPGTLPGVRIINPVFDVTPPEFVSGVVTERGVIAPAAAYTLIVQEFGEVESWNGFTRLTE